MNTRLSRIFLLAPFILFTFSPSTAQSSGLDIPEEATTVKFVYDGGQLGRQDDAPMVGERFLYDDEANEARLATSSNMASFAFTATADFRETVFDFTEVPRNHRVITFASVEMPDGLEYYVALHAEESPIVFFDTNHVAIPAHLQASQAKGPFATFKFQCTSAGKAVSGVSIDLVGPSGKLAEATSGPEGRAEALVGNLDYPTIRFTASIAGGEGKKEGVLAIPIVGLADDLITYHSIKVDF